MSCPFMFPMFFMAINGGILYPILRQTHECLRAVCIAVIIVIVLIVTKRIDDCCSDSLLQSKADDRST